MAKIPEFATLDEAVEFWETHSFADYVDDTEAVELEVNLETDQVEVIHVYLEPRLAQRLKDIAEARGTISESLVHRWLEERLLEEAPQHKTE